MTTQEYIIQHRDDEPAALALKGAPEGVDLHFALQQIEGRQTAVKKLPRWAAVDGIVYPVRLSMQQCSSQSTAEYKASLVKRLVPDGERKSMIDLTGGLGVDFSFLATLFDRAVYVERDEALCDAARHNLPLLGLTQAEVVSADASTQLEGNFSFIFLDPARRDGVGRKLVQIEDCQPDVAAIHETLLSMAPVVMVKLSPMLDVSEALRRLHHVAEVHIVAADGECKELLVVMRRGHEAEAELHCQGIAFTRSQEASTPPHRAESLGQYLYIPSPAMMKAAPFRLLSHLYGVEALPPDTHLYTSSSLVNDFPGRTFAIDAECDVKNFRRLHPDVVQANVIVRGYPDTVESLRHRLKLKDGGNRYVIATTLPSGRRALLLCHLLGTANSSLQS